LVVLVLVAGCAGDDSGVPSMLIDGSPARELTVDLEGVDVPALRTSIRVTGPSEVENGSSEQACLDGPLKGYPPTGPVVRRIGTTLESVTFRDEGNVYSCDNSLGPRTEDRRWCGGAAGILYADRLRDPRLDLGCVTEDGTQLASAWVQPRRQTRFVIVHEPDYAEAYEVAAALPVRVATSSGAQIQTFSASFEISEHDASGALVRRYRLEAVIAG
jgi:hypothetical protein